MFKRFFVLTRGRTGSTAIMDEFHGCKNISATQELFLQWNFSVKSEDTREMFDIIWPYVLWKAELKSNKTNLLRLRGDRSLANRYLSIAEARSRRRGSVGFGFKVLRNNLDEWPFLLQLLKRRSYQAIYLKRNTANRVLSGLIANKSGVWNTKDKNVNLGKYRIDIEEFKRYGLWEQNQVEFDLSLLSSMEIPYLLVTYEAYCNEREAFFEEVFSYLDLPVQLPSSSEYQILLKDLPEIIENYDQVVKIAEEIGIPFGY